MELALTGSPITAAEAYSFGLANRLVPVGEALATAIELAEQISANGPLAVIATKQVIVNSRDWSANEAFERQEETAGPVRNSADAKEGALAFVEKRPPHWIGQ
jgi:enoyl-CoA hydratase